MDHSAHPRLAPSELTPDVLEGATIYGADDEKVGKVSHVHGIGEASTIVVDVGGFLGIGLAYYLYIVAPGSTDRIRARAKGLYTLLVNKWYFDELYDTIFVRPAIWVGRAFWKGFDDWLIDDKLSEAAASDPNIRLVHLSELG